MKKHHAIRWTTLGLVVAVAAGLLYCNLATWYYDPDVFARRAWTYATTEQRGVSDSIREHLLAAGWESTEETAEVEMVQGHSIGATRDGWQEFNLNLLMLNGGRAVHVMLHTDLDGLLGPIGIYFNPFTGVVVGYDLLA
jgi:hypothetical protein